MSLTYSQTLKKETYYRVTGNFRGMVVIFVFNAKKPQSLHVKYWCVGVSLNFSL